MVEYEEYDEDEEEEDSSVEILTSFGKILKKNKTK